VDALFAVFSSFFFWFITGLEFLASLLDTHLAATFYRLGFSFLFWGWVEVFAYTTLVMSNEPKQVIGCSCGYEQEEEVLRWWWCR
jgi:hypothetical protein